MIATSLGLLALTVVGIPPAIALHRESRPMMLLGEAFLLGCGLTSFVLLLISVIGLTWTPLVVTASVTLSSLALWLLVSRQKARQTTPRTDPAVRDGKLIAGICMAITAIVVLGYARFATLAPLWEWDFWAIWGLKGKVFFEHGGIDWDFLQRPENVFAHPDYPLLLPLLYDFIAVLNGFWEERWIGLFFPAFAVATLLMLGDLMGSESGSAAYGAIAALAFSGFACSFWVGMAEGPLIAFSATGLLLIRRGIKTLDRQMTTTGAVLLGLAAFTKNEGISLVVAVWIAALVQSRGRWREVLPLWPSLVLMLPWLILKKAYALELDLAEGSVAARLADRLAHPVELLSALAEAVPGHSLFWIALVVILIWRMTAISSETLVLLTVTLQLGFYLVAYLVTPHSVRWHVGSSWVRILHQVGIPLTYVALVLLLPKLRGVRGVWAAETMTESPAALPEQDGRA